MDMTTPKVKFEDGTAGKQQQQPRQAAPGNRGKKQKANQQGQTGARSPSYQSPIDEIKDNIFSVGNTSFKSNVEAIANYAQVHMGITADVASAFRDGKAAVIPPPARPTPGSDGKTYDEFEMLEYKMKFGDYMKEEKKARTSLQSLFPLLLGQCDDYLRGRIKNRSAFQQLLSSSDTVGLLRAIEEEGYSVNNHEFPFINSIKCLNRISRLRSDKQSFSPTDPAYQLHDEYPPRQDDQLERGFPRRPSSIFREPRQQSPDEGNHRHAQFAQRSGEAHGRAKPASAQLVHRLDPGLVPGPPSLDLPSSAGVSVLRSAGPPGPFRPSNSVHPST